MITKHRSCIFCTDG